MVIVEELLLETLKDLGDKELKEFQYLLRTGKEVFKSDMENADRMQTVDIMVEQFTQEEAVKIMVEILKKIKKNNLAKKLEEKYTQAQAKDSQTKDAEVNSKPNGVITPTDINPAPSQGTSSSTNPPAITPTGINPAPPQGTSSSTNPPATNIVPRTRKDFLKYFCRFTLDRNTAHKRLRLPEGNREVSFTNKEHSYPDHRERFDYYTQVLCRESVSVCCYWEIDWEAGDGVYISVSYKSIGRKGNDSGCVFGHNDQSWSLFCSPSRYTFIHNDNRTELRVVSSRRVGVYVDQNEGNLSFYSVSGDSMSLIHTVPATFTKPLYPGFYVDYESSLTLVD